MNEFIPSSERQSQILDLLAQQGSLSVAEIVEQFSISEATARRDLETLAGEGKLQRVHGGAISSRQAPPEPPILQRESWQSDEKQRIGRATADLIGDDETIFLGSGTTVLEVARNLKKRKGLTVITNSLPIMNTSATCRLLASLPWRHPAQQRASFIGHITEDRCAICRSIRSLSASTPSAWNMASPTIICLRR
jgi:DeoR/GlpR family transcriptional regulator of sugar metabolism